MKFITENFLLGNSFAKTLYHQYAKDLPIIDYHCQSFPRHEYFRRILCNVIGRDVESGELPDDEKWLGKIVSDICYHNAKAYFNF